MTQLARQALTQPVDLLGLAAVLHRRYEARTSLNHRKMLGQFFTPPAVATFMARWVSTARGRLRILDPGAGMGALSAAICERLAGFAPPCAVEFVLFEADREIIPSLEECMRRCRGALQEAGHDMSYTIHEADFVLSNRPRFDQELLFADSDRLGEFDAVIMNPPYFKLNKESAHARAFERVIHGQPNIYALFMAAAAAMLRPEGELVAITPRSFCNGLYFREFRRWLFERMALRRIHLFESRTETFQGANVLQESVITMWKKSARADRPVMLSTSYGADLAAADAPRAHPASRIIDDALGDFIIRIPGSPADADIMEVVESWPSRFADHGLQISTGPVVTFRATQYLLMKPHVHAAPLIFPHNIHPFETRWPLVKIGKPLGFRVCDASEKLVLPMRNYVLLRRFSSKEEHRRLTASCLLLTDARWPARIAIENHVNYVYHTRRELTETETFGLAALFNSALLDRYFRTQSGNTQVNATEIRAMPFPALDVIAEIGARVRSQGTIERGAVDQVVLDVLAIGGTVARELKEKSR
jgi:adenine-specific DNA-methyltransferase